MVASPDPPKDAQGGPGEPSRPRGKRKRAPRGAPSSQQSGRRKYFSHFRARKKPRFSLLRFHGGPKIPPGRDPRRSGFPIGIRAEGPFWDPKNGTIGAFSVSQKRIRLAGGDFWVPNDAKHQKSSKIITFQICGRTTAPPGPQNGPTARPGERRCLSVLRKWAPRGAPEIAACRAGNFFSHFSARKKTSFFVFAIARRPKNPARARSEALRNPE